MGARQFTLTSLIVSIVIAIAVGVGLFLPYRAAAIRQEQAIQCQFNIHKLSNAFLIFAADHGGRLPGTVGTSNKLILELSDWLMGQYARATDVSVRVESAPQYGTIWVYIKDYQIYRCPSVESGKLGSGVGSNGRFDYAAFPEFGGTRINLIRPSSELHDPNGGHVSVMPTPIVCQEDVAFSINTTGLDGQHVAADRMAHVHGGGAYYGAIDGSVVWVNEPVVSAAPSATKPGTGLWFTTTPATHRIIPIGVIDPPEWDWWARQ